MTRIDINRTIFGLLRTPSTMHRIHAFLTAAGHQISRDELCDIVWDLENRGTISRFQRRGRRMYRLSGAQSGRHVGQRSPSQPSSKNTPKSIQGALNEVHSASQSRSEGAA